MVTTLKDENGLVTALCEWRLVGKSCYDTPNGHYVWINEVWVHEKERFKMMLNRLIDEVMTKVPASAVYAYFSRKKYNGRLKMFSRESWERRRRCYMPVEKGS